MGIDIAIEGPAASGEVSNADRRFQHISYGRAWYAWFMRRIAEKPSNILLIARR